MGWAAMHEHVGHKLPNLELTVLRKIEREPTQHEFLLPRYHAGKDKHHNVGDEEREDSWRKFHEGIFKEPMRWAILIFAD